MTHPLHHATVEGPLGFPLTDRQAIALETILKALPKDDAFKYRKFVVTKAASEVLPGDRTDVSWISTEAVDRVGDVVLARGMNDSQFKLNPIVTLEHCYNLPPVGKSLWRKVVKDGDRMGVKAKTHYPNRPSDWPVNKDWPADIAFALVQAGLMQGKSIGLLPTKIHFPNAYELDTLGKSIKCIIDEWLLVEYACTAIPVNQQAVVEMVSKGTITIPEDIQRILGIDLKSRVATKEQRENARFKLRDENGDIKFPINDCADVADAWQLRGHSNISKDKVEAYIKRVAAKLGCSGPWNDAKAMASDSTSGEWYVNAIDTFTLSTFTPLEEVEKAILRRVHALDIKSLADKVAQDTLDRLRGRV